MCGLEVEQFLSIWSELQGSGMQCQNEPMLGKVIEDNLPWESKGRGVAIFGVPRSLELGTLPPNTQVVDADTVVALEPTACRVVVVNFEERHLTTERAAQSLIDRLLLPLYRAKIPVYFLSQATRSLFACGKLPFGSQANVNEAMGRLKREQIGQLLAMSCICISEDTTVNQATGTPETPIESKLAKALRDAGIAFDQQVPLGPYIADFTLRTAQDGILVVEADGREFHDSGRDAVRDRILIAEHGVRTVLRLSGSQIWHNPDACVRAISEAIQCVEKEDSVTTNGAQLEPFPLSRDQTLCLAPRDGAILTLAPAGSGKTRVLTRRVIEAVRNGATPERILCLVFNKRAEQEMKRRIHQQAGLRKIAVRTLHSLGLEIIRNSSERAYAGFDTIENTGEGGLRDYLRDAVQQIRLEKETPSKHIPDDVYTAYQEYISVHKRTLVEPSDSSLGASVDGFDLAEAREVRQRLDELLTRDQKLTFDDHIFRAVELLLKNPKDRFRYQHRFDVVLVDEVQDLTPVQFLLVRLMAMPLNNLFAVGDDDQMIYSFTGADPRNLRSFTEWFEGATKHTLGENHRCSPEVVKLSANLISHNLSRFDKNIRPVERKAPVRPSIARTFVGSSADAEAKEVAKQIAEWHGQGFKYSDMAVLVRVKTVASIVQVVLKAAGIPFQPLENTVFFGSPPVRLILAYIKVSVNPMASRRPELDLVLSKPFRYLTVNERSGLSIGGWPSVKHHDGLPPLKAKLVEEFVVATERVHQYIRRSTTKAVDAFGYMLAQHGLEEHFRKADKNGTNLETLTGVDILSVLRGMSSEHDTLNGFAAWLEEQAQNERKRDPALDGGERGDGVLIQTIHKVKGEEFQCVALYQVNENVLPHRHALESQCESAVEEERRVCYVGVTRAIENLLVTASSADVSRFVAELSEARGAPKPVVASVPVRPPAGVRIESSKPPRSLLGSILDFLADLFGA